MKIFNYDITLKNIGAFVQGKGRLMFENLGFDLEDHIKEQIVWRESKALPECINNEVCKCGCDIPDLFYADKACEFGCYPKLMNKEEWEQYKKDENI